ncbi:DUF1254 domain-containing protein [Paraglaciecola sp. MB-3u-78]|uniref:DUF1254 domain-containing protein n=1 Tax=Paraglaciecola sp. MB-3u-78 TaxID=2058332 RepID=UPI000C3377B5|nr:DUF1254 domain-containing protein [Paraglaciecola sp. MB-3u-78]PKG96202.1 hypothetical protein CXF95_24990 [Paraglaciecola sp. MB-3u-78]
MKKLVLGLVIVVAILAAGLIILKEIKVGSQTYLYGYPLLVMEKSRLAMQGVDGFRNKFHHKHNLPDHSFRTVVRPNNDTLYSIAWLDLANEGQVLSVPDMGERYYVMPFMDAWTNVFASVGTRETGIKKGDYLITGPNWQGDVPDGLPQIKAPTNMVWLIGRIQINGDLDIAEVSAIQKSFKLASQTQWLAGEIQPFYTSDTHKLDQSISPNKQVEAMTSTEFFTELSRLLKTQATLRGDELILETLAHVGVVPGQDFNKENHGWLKTKLYNFIFKVTKKKLIEKLENGRSKENGWNITRDLIGNYGTNYKFRAAVTKVGLGALPPDEAIYASASVDYKGQRLSGAHQYIIHFPVGQMPPVKAFWSITMYDEDGFVVESAINRYLIGNRDSLNFNDDGSLDIVIQYAPPEKDTENWLPTPKGTFTLIMRLYLPKKRILNGSWEMPPLVRE